MKQFAAVQALAAATACVMAACGGSRPPSPGGPTDTSPAVSFSTHQSAHFTFRYTAMDAATIAQTATDVEAAYSQIVLDLGVTQMPTVVITLYATNDAMREAVMPIVGPIPSFATGLITGPTAVHILSPRLAARWSYGEAIPSIIHEFAHCVSLQLNPSLANNPRWLWETVALFEALQFDDAATRPIVTVGPLPSFAQLNSFDNTLVYGVGAWLGLFVQETRGWETYRELIRANGDTARVLGKSETVFLNEWAAWVRANTNTH